MRKVVLAVFFFISVFWVLQVARAATVGPVLPLAKDYGNQQNPTVVALPDKGFWFVAWEDWRNPLNADIYGAFVKPEETADDEAACREKNLFWYQGKCYRGLSVCETFPIITKDGNQQTPAAAYDPDDDKIIVVWKDDGQWDTDHAWLQLAYRVLNVPDNCTSFNATTDRYDIQWVPYDPIFDCAACTGTCSCRRNYRDWELCMEAGHFWNGTDCLETPDGNNIINNTTLCSELYSEGFIWDEDNESCYKIQQVSFINSDRCQDTYFFSDNFTFPDYDECNANDVCGQDNNETSEGLCRNKLGPGWFSTEDDNGIAPRPLEPEELVLREAPQVVYNSHDQAFWFSWTEVRTERNRIRFISCIESDYEVGEGVFPAYGRLNVEGNPDWDNLTSKWEEVDILRNRTGWGEQTARVLEVSSTETGFQATYEYFTSVDSVCIAPDLRNGGVYFTFSGRRMEGTLTVDCEKGQDSWEDKENPEGHYVFGILSWQAKESGINSQKISSESPTFHPAVEYDPVTGNFLVVWEDTRDTGINNPKIYGQIISMGSGTYLGNFPLTTEEELGSLWPLVRQTSPAISWDAVNQRFFVAWQDNRAGVVSVENIDIYGQHVDPEGSLRGQNMLVSATEEGQPTAGNQLAPQVSYDPASGLYLAVWKDARNYDETGSDIYAQLFSVGQGQLTILDGNGTPLHPTVIDFGVLHAGERVSRSFFLRNTGDAEVNICELSRLSAPFAYLLVDQRLVDGDEGSCLALQPLMQVEVMVEFAPTEEGSFSATIGISTDAGEHTILLQGATRPVISADRTSFEFGEVLVGSSRGLSLTLVNHIDEEVRVGQVVGFEGPFELEGISSGAVIPAGGSLTGRVIFSPQEVGNFTAEVRFTFSRGGGLTLHLSGTGKESPFLFDPTNLDFGALKAGNARELSFVVQNQGGQSITLIEISGPEKPFTLKGPVPPQEIPPGENLSFSVFFTPGEKGIYQGEIIFKFEQGEKNIEASYTLSGRALGLPGCVRKTLPERVMLNPGQRPVWLLGITGDEDLLLSRMVEPAILGFLEFSRRPGSYLFALTPPKDLEPYTYRDRLSLLFAGARRPLNAETTLILTDPPPGWESCVPALTLAVEGKSVLLLKNGSLPRELHLTLGINLPCAPEGTQVSASLKVNGPQGETFYYDLSQGFVPYKRSYKIAVPLSFQEKIRIPLPPELEPGLWLFDLRLEAGGEVFYRQAAVVVDELTNCQTIDLAE